MAGQAIIKAGVDRRSQIMQFVVGYQKARGISPSMREIATNLGVSPGTVCHHVDILVREGELQRDEGKYRTLRAAR